MRDEEKSFYFISEEGGIDDDVWVLQIASRFFTLKIRLWRIKYFVLD